MKYREILTCIALTVFAFSSLVSAEDDPCLDKTLFDKDQTTFQKKCPKCHLTMANFGYIGTENRNQTWWINRKINELNKTLKEETQPKKKGAFDFNLENVTECMPHLEKWYDYNPETHSATIKPEYQPKNK